MILLAVDPGYTKSATSIWKNGKLIAVTYCNTKVKAISDFLNKEVKKDDFILACETQYLGLNANTLEKLLFARHLWEVLSYIHPNNVGVCRVSPRSWQAFCLGEFAKGQSKPTSIKRFIQETNDVLGIDDHNLADAYHIGKYVLKNYNKISLEEL